MIRINLLGVERPKARKVIAFDQAQQVTVACSLILVLTAAGIGWWYWSLNQASQQVDAELASAQQEAARLRTVLTAVRNFETTRTQLQQRVALIQQLRRGQSVPVQLLDHVSRSLPDMLWLTEMDETGSNLTITGLSTTLVAVSDFVANLGNSPLLKKPIDIVNTEVQSTPSAAAGAPATPDVIKFTVKAQLADVAAADPAAPKAAAATPR
jgi:type IV pilus assembly protein PilN